MNNLKYRMYSLVPYNLSPIQQAIQAGHCIEQYAFENHDDEIYQQYITNDKTWIILNGGTTNNGDSYLDGKLTAVGTMQEHLKLLVDNNVKVSIFKEPDLNNALTAICFVVDERVWDRENYPDLFEVIVNNHADKNFNYLRHTVVQELSGMFPDDYREWKALIGGKKNVFLREFLRNKKLA